MRTPRPLSVLAAGLLALTACGGGDGEEAQDFCDELTAVNDQLADASQTTPQQADDIAAALDELEPPGEIQEAYDNVRDLYRQIAADDAALTDPELATDFANVQVDIEQIQNFTTDECEASTGE